MLMLRWGCNAVAGGNWGTREVMVGHLWGTGFDANKKSLAVDHPAVHVLHSVLHPKRRVTA